LDACGADAELIALAKQCLELEPRDRPRDAGALAQRVTDYLESVEAKLRATEMARATQATRLEQEQRWARKLRKMIAGLAAVAAIAMATSIVAGSFWQAANFAKRKTEESEKVARENEEHAKHSQVIAQSEAIRANAQKLAAEENLAKAEKAEREATEQRKRADHEAETSRRNLYYAQMHLAHHAWREHKGTWQMRALLPNWVPKDSSPDPRGWEWFYLNSLPHQNVRTLPERWRSNGQFSAVVWHAASGRLAEGSADGLIRIWDVDREQTVQTLKGAAPGYRTKWLDWSRDGGKLVAGGSDGTVHVWETASGRELKVFRGHRASIASVAFSADGTRVVSWGQDGAIKIWDVIADRLTADVTHPGGVTAGAWSPDEKILATGHFDGSVTISGLHASDERRTLQGHVRSINGIAWRPDSTQLASVSSDFNAKIWDVASGKLILGPLVHSHEVTAVAWEPDGRKLATGCCDETVKIWDSSTCREIRTLRGMIAEFAISLAWGPDGRLAGGGHAGVVKIWNSSRDQESDTLPGQGVRQTAVVWSPNGKLLASGGDDGKIRIWDRANSQEVLAIHGHDAGRGSQQFGLIHALAWSPAGTQLASAGHDGNVKVWDVSNGQEIFTLPADRGAFWSLAWSPDGSHLAAGSDDGTIRVAEVLKHTANVNFFKANETRTGEPMGRDWLATHVVGALAWSPQGDRLASGGPDSLVKVWDPIRGVEIGRMQGHSDYIFGLAWSPDGKQLASAGSDLAITWDAETGRRLATMRGHNDWVNAITWSPDGTRLASAGLDNSVRLWDPATGEETLVLRGNSGMFHDVAWHPDGMQLAAAGSDGQIWIWNATPGIERDSTPRALPFIDRAVASGNVRSEDYVWYVQAYIRSGKHFAEQGDVSLANSAFEKGADLLAKSMDMRAIGSLLEIDLSLDGVVDSMSGRHPEKYASLLPALASAAAERRQFDRARSLYERLAKLQPENEQWQARINQLRPGVWAVWNFDAGFGPWGNAHNCELGVQNGVLTVRTTGDNPFFSTAVSAPAGGQAVVLRYRSDEACTLQIFWADTTGGFDESRHLDTPIPAAADEWHEVTIPFSSQGAFTALRLAPNTSPEHALKIDSILLRRLEPDDVEISSAKGDLLVAAAGAYQAAGRTREAIPILVKASSASPQDTLLSLKLAALQAWLGQEQEFAATRQRILAFAKDTSEAMTAERAAKACSILPCTDETSLVAALDLARAAMKIGNVGEFGEWNLLALGMAEYRIGNYIAAEQTLLAAAKAGPNNPHITGTSAFYRAMSQFRQGQNDEARQLAIAAAAQMPPWPADEDNPLANVTPPVGGGDTQEYLILWLAVKEAKELIKFTDAPENRSP
ncbi:MAG: hypothetical protein JSS02_29430, partial [Planctomycetes bacterium]|nr:hypothetical protein [Planctomycetota bacterium]